MQLVTGVLVNLLQFARLREWRCLYGAANPYKPISGFLRPQVSAGLQRHARRVRPGIDPHQKPLPFTTLAGSPNAVCNNADFVPLPAQTLSARAFSSSVILGLRAQNFTCTLL